MKKLSEAFGFLETHSWKVSHGHSDTNGVEFKICHIFVKLAQIYDGMPWFIFLDRKSVV